MNLNIVIIDYDIGNVRSIYNALEKIGVTPCLSRDEEVILNADGIILPGVGAFSHGMKKLNNYALEKTIKKFAATDKPLLGICLGMQILFDESEEFGTVKGLGLIKGKVTKIDVENQHKQKLPHISWNELHSTNVKWEKTILHDIEQGCDMYFVHSFAVLPEKEENILSLTSYAQNVFCSSVKQNNLYGCQFHPEKSSEKGLKIIENFINICKEFK